MLKTWEAKMGNKSILLRGLPATGFTKNNIDWKSLPEEEQGPRGQLQTDLRTLQIWPGREAPTISLLTQVSYTLDLRFPRRYVRDIFIISQFLEEVQPQWQEAFDSNMDKTNQPIQAFYRAAVDKSTTYRFSFDTCFDLTNFISNSDLFQDIFLGMDSYANNEPMHLSLVYTCVTDVTYWQLALVFKRWPKDKSQLRIHNRGLRQCHSFTGHSPTFLYEQLKLAGAASGLPGDHGPAFSFSFISLFSAICLLTVRLVVTNPAVRCGTDGIRIFAQDHSFIVG